MTDPIELLLIGALVAVVLIATYAFTDYGSRRRVEKDFKNPQDILDAVDVYVKYGRERAAIELLKRGLERHPAHPALQAKLTHLTEGRP
jgi:hypothetical protein